VAVDDSNVLLFLEYRLVETFLNACLRFVNITPNHVKVWDGTVAAVDLYRHVTARLRGWFLNAALVQDLEISNCDAKALALRINLGLVVVEAKHVSLDSQDAYDHAGSNP
tara:strand:- start:101 stop:430 length:330 start_codon:yes stop_codon:yes gene_type:complete